MAPLPAALSLAAVLAAAVVPALLWWTVGEPVLQLGVILVVLVGHERLGRRRAAGQPGEAVSAAAPGTRSDVLVSVGLALLIVAVILLFELGSGRDVWGTIGPFTAIAPGLVLIREVTLRRRRGRALAGGRR